MRVEGQEERVIIQVNETFRQVSEEPNRPGGKRGAQAVKGGSGLVKMLKTRERKNHECHRFKKKTGEKRWAREVERNEET